VPGQKECDAAIRQIQVNTVPCFRENLTVVTFSFITSPA